MKKKEAKKHMRKDHGVPKRMVRAGKVGDLNLLHKLMHTVDFSVMHNHDWQEVKAEVVQ